jgi:RsiW-degrading membrane proteinase PrsW (M82 family)
MSAPKNMFHPTDRMLRQFAALWILFFLAIAARQEFQHHHHMAAVVLAALAVTVGPLGLAWPRGIRPIFIGWMGLAYPIGWTVSRIVLGIIFYGLFTPVAWIFRLIGRDELVLKAQPNAVTYWHSKPGAADKAQYMRQF